MLALAGRILRDYGRVLGEIEPGCCALPRSFLPHPRTAIREATLHVLAGLGQGDEALRDALIRGFVFLAQFVEDEEAERVALGQAQMDTLALEAGEEPQSPQALDALRVVNRIKLEMEQSLLQACAAARIPLSQAPSMLR
ncbi:MAG: hypothetical protein R3F18_05345 [Lysobacterales bacterium]|nr:hypothetical protein [Xanthomonadales bacterium]MCB1612506.1 hypothetical protein [Xanthomonadales bacterium]MCP5474048.1 hypothetical protein [Rhodanobacteraceae bacterium]